MKHLRVAFITHYKSLYGANRSLLELLDEIPKFDISPHVIMPSFGEGSLLEILNQKGIPCYTLKFHNWYHPEIPDNAGISARYTRCSLSAKSLVRNTLSLRPLLMKLHEWRIEIVHTNSIITPIGFWGSKIMRIPHVWHLRELIDLHYSQSPDFGYFFTQKMIERSDSIIAVSKAVKDHFFPNQFLPQVRIIYDGVNIPTRFQRIPNRSIIKGLEVPSDFIFLLLGALHPRKGIEIALLAIEQLVQKGFQVKLLIAGQGSPKYEQHCKTLVNNLSLTHHVEFLGFLDNPFEAYVRADALLMCSEFEAFGRVTLEALSIGLPVIGNASCGTLELIIPDDTGLLYNGKLDDLVKNMKRLIESPELVAKLGERAAEFSRRFSVENTAKKIAEIYTILAKKNINI